MSFMSSMPLQPSDMLQRKNSMANSFVYRYMNEMHSSALSDHDSSSITIKPSAESVNDEQFLCSE